MTDEAPGRTRNGDHRHKHDQVSNTQVDTRCCPRNDLARDGAIAMSRDVEINHRDYDRGYNSGSDSRGGTHTQSTKHAQMSHARLDLELDILRALLRLQPLIVGQ